MGPVFNVSKIQKTSVSWGISEAYVTLNNTGEANATLLQVFISENLWEESNYTATSNLPLTVSANTCVTVNIGNFNYTEGKVYKFRFVCDDGESTFLEQAPTSSSDYFFLSGVGWEEGGIDLYLSCVTSKTKITLFQCYLNSTEVTAVTNLPISVKASQIGIVKINSAYLYDATYMVEVKAASQSFSFTIVSPPSVFTFESADVDSTNDWILFTVAPHKNMVVQKIELSFDNETFIDVTAHSSAVIEPSLRAGQTSFLYILFPNELDTKILDEKNYYVCLTMTNKEKYCCKLG